VNAALDVLDALEAELLWQMRQEALRAEWEAQRGLGKRWARMYNPHYKKFARDEATGEIDAQGKAHGEESGKYVETEGGDTSAEGESKSALLEKLIGPEYTGVKGHAAIIKLLEEKQGHVKAAFYRKEIGDIDLYWGDDGLGLQHIIAHREERGQSGQKVLREIAEVIERGNVEYNVVHDNYDIHYKGLKAVIAIDLHGNEINYLLTAFVEDTRKLGRYAKRK
jgi:hypothetical protein